MRHVTIKDIARIAGVSASTVSRALNGSTELSEATRRRILEICQQEGYHVNVLARSLIKNRTNILGLIVPEITNPYYSELSFAVETYARERGYNIMLCNSLYNSLTTEKLFEHLISHQVDGILLANSSNESAMLVRKFSPMVASVLIGTHGEEFNDINSVSVDNLTGGRLAGQHLLELGHKNIIYAGFRSENMSHLLRFRGFCKVLKDAGLEPEVLENKEDHSSISCGYELGKAIFSAPLKHTAIFASTDSLALGILKAADECSISIPEDISLLGFDNILYSSLPRITLSTVDQQKQLQAEAAVDMLLDLIESRSKNAKGSVRRLICPELIKRGSCLPVK